MEAHRKPIFALSTVILIAFTMTHCRVNEARTTLRILVADSLWRPFDALARAFEAQYSDTRIVLIPNGSVLAARRITEANDRADVLAVADPQVINRLLKPRFADWSICFATNEIVIAYTSMSRGASTLTQENWFDVLSGRDVRVGAANPFHDPCGYWTLLCWRLADRHYRREQGATAIYDRLSARCGPPDDRRTDAQQLLHLLESAGGIDYAFVYRSQALQHNLASLRLPGAINLGDAAFTETYRTVRIDLAPDDGGAMFTRRGDVIVYALTIPKIAAHPEQGAKFVSFLLSARGREILEDEHVQLLKEPWTENMKSIPPSLRTAVVDHRGAGHAGSGN